MLSISLRLCEVKRLNRGFSKAYLLDMGASLRRDQRLFPRALKLHKEALALARPEEVGVIRMNQAVTLEETGDAEGALRSDRLALSTSPITRRASPPNRVNPSPEATSAASVQMKVSRAAPARRRVDSHRGQSPVRQLQAAGQSARK